MQHSVSRRDFLGGAATAGVGLSLGLSSATAAEKTMSKVASASAAAAKPALEWPIFDAREEKALLDVLHSGKWGRTAGGSHYVKDFETAFAQRMRAKHCVATSSGTTALLTSLGALDIGPGDEVILPPYTFVATFNVITANYALPVFVDTDPATFQIDARKISAAITPATRLLLPVHIAGSTCDIGAIAELARTKKITLLEDACQAPLAEWKDQPVGTQGIGGCFSFQASKNLTSGEGGAIVTNDDTFADRCYDFHTPGNPKKSATTGRASNYRLTEFQASLLLAQVTRVEEQFKQREANAAYLTSLLEKIPGITPAKLASGNNRSGWHLYMLRYDKTQFANLPREKFLQALGKAGVVASAGYTSLNTSPHVTALATNRHYQRIYGKDTMTRWLERNQCPVNDQLVQEAVWLSQTKLLAPRSEMERIAETVAGIQKRAGELAKA